MLGAVASFLAMALAGRSLSAELGTFQILFFRSVVGLVVVGALAWRARLAVWRSGRLGLHIGRNLAHFGGQFGWFYALGVIPLAQVFAIEFTVPLWTALLAAALLGERLTARRGLALALGFGGVLVILWPSLSSAWAGTTGGLPGGSTAGAAEASAWTGTAVATAAALASAAAYGLSYIATKRLTPTDPPLSILFYMTLIQLPLGLLGAMTQWQPVAVAHAPALLVVGLTALTAHYCIARALACADLAVVIPVDFLRLPLVAVIGYAFYGEAVGAWLVAGMLLIVGANLANLGAGRVAGPTPSAPPSPPPPPNGRSG
jgi:drug/metabolite transporter (DMT)-like permease